VAKLIMRISYILCLLSGALAVVARIVATFVGTSTLFSGHVLPIGYHSFMDGVLLFFMLTLASASVEFVDKRNR
jgi:hypothetical protein